MFFDDELKKDPKDVDYLLSKELMHMSIADRNAINEEIHGVHCLALDETPEFLSNLLRNLAFELDEVLLPTENFAYRRSQKLPTTYVNTLDFRLRFLRCELFDAQKAAKRMAFFLNYVMESFGEFALERPVRLSDFNKEEMACMRKGLYQWLPFRDRSGRRIVVVFPKKELALTPARIKAKITLYMCWTAGNDIESQRSGIVVLIWYDKSFTLNMSPVSNKPKLHEIATVRICAVHLCTPDTSVYRLRRSFATMRMSHHRLKLRTHLGNTVENHYSLQAFGIPTETIPITYSGTVKVSPMRQWMRLRTFLEEPIYQNSADVQSIIECPYPSDIVFRQGSSFLSHSGNITFRSLIVAKINEIENEDNAFHNENLWILYNTNKKRVPTKAKDKKKFMTKVIVQEVIEEMKRMKRRVLNWNDAQGCWKILDDEIQINLKIEYLVREYRGASKAQTNRQSSESDTFMFCSSNRHGPITKNAMTTVGDYYDDKAVQRPDSRNNDMGCFTVCGM